MTYTGYIGYTGSFSSFHADNSKRKHFPKKHTREKSGVVLRGEEVSDFEFESIFQDQIEFFKRKMASFFIVCSSSIPQELFKTL